MKRVISSFLLGISVTEMSNSLQDEAKQDPSGNQFINSNSENKNKLALEQLKKYNISVTKESMADFVANPRTAVLKVDLLEWRNLIACVAAAINVALTEDSTNQFMMGKQTLAQKVNANGELKREFNHILKYIRRLEINGDEDLREHFVHMYRKLKRIASQIDKDQNFSKDSPLVRFIKSVTLGYRSLISAQVADKIMQELGSDAKDTVQSTKIDSKAFANATVGHFGVGVEASRKEGATDTSMCTIEYGKSLRFAVGASSFGFGIWGGVTAEVKRSAIFFSLDQLLDSDASSYKLLSDDMRQMADARGKMQKRERELMSVFQRDIEGVVQMFGIIPIGVVAQFPNVTRAAPIDSAKSVVGSIDVTASALASLGFSVKASSENKKYGSQSSYLSLIQNDCFATDGMQADDVIKIIGGKQYDLSSKYGGKSDQNVLPIILGDIRSYIQILDERNSGDSRQLIQSKHDLEKRWTPKKIFGTGGRLEVLKTMVATIVKLRETATTDREIELFKQMYQELIHLHAMLEFSQSNSQNSASYTKTAEAKIYSANGMFSFGIPVVVGDIVFNVDYLYINGSPYYEENGKFGTISVTAPLSGVGTAFTEALKKKLTGLIDGSELPPKNTNEQENEKRKEMLALLKNFHRSAVWDMLSLIRLPLEAKGSSTFSCKLVKVCKNNSDPDIIPLPNSDVIIRIKDVWVPQYFEVLATISAEGKTDVDIAVAGVTAKLGNRIKIMTPDTMTYITATFNKFKFGNETSKQKNAFWNDFVENNRGKILELFRNVTVPTSNVRYDLQNMYNGIMNGIGANQTDVRNRCRDVFAEFLSKCSTLDAGTSAAEALNLLDEILELNYIHVYLEKNRSSYKEVRH
ncbi:MAG: hypothetical protein LBF54_00025 [Holosporaceae bacterium]|jgi:hypothetical protein|nr:hypothetical protein [Holosporaceae bacterium]